MKALLILTRTMGDVILGNLLAKNIKLQYPGIQLDYVIEASYYDLVKNSPYIDCVVQILDTKNDWNNVLKRIGSKDYDKLFFAQQTTGWDNCWHQREEDRHSHLLDFYAKRCEIELQDRALTLTCEIDENFPTSPHSKPTIAVHTQTLAPVKDWSYFEGLITMLESKGYTIVQLGSKYEKSYGTTKITDSLGNIMKMFNAKYFDCFIGLDSGLTYMATAFGCPVVQIMGATVPTTSGAWGDTVRTVLAPCNEACIKARNDIRCHGIDGGQCKYGRKCIDSITVNMVVDEVESLLKGV